MRLLIVGCGDLGGRVAKIAAARGDHVIGVRREPAGVPGGVEGLAGDVGDPASLAFPGGLDAMVYAVAASERTDGAYARAYPVGLRNALAALDGAGCDVPVVFVSSTAVYGEDRGGWVDEDTDPNPRRFNGVRMGEAEGVLARRGRGTSLRLGGIYGPGRTRLIESVRSKAPMGEAAGDAAGDAAPSWTNRIHVDDAARALVHLVDRHLGERAPDAVINGVDQEPALRADVMAFIAGRLGFTAPNGGAGHEESRPTSNKRVRGDRLRGTGFELEYPTYREGYAALIAATGK